MGVEGKALSLYRKKVFGKTCCMEKILPRIPSSVIYMPMHHQFFFSKYLNHYCVVFFIY
jgi:hypothetical protein